MPAGGPIWVGAFYNPALGREFLGAPDLFDHVAMAGPPRPEDHYFPEIPPRFVVLLHDLHDIVGPACDTLNTVDLERARELVSLLRAPWAVLQIRCASTESNEIDLRHPLPPNYSEEMLGRFVSGVKSLADRIGVELLLENVPSFLPSGPDEMSEGRFLKRLFAEARCGLSLDLTSIWLTAHYRDQSPMDLLGTFPMEPVVELQLGATATDPDFGGPWAAPGMPSTELLDMASFTVERAPRLRAITFDAVDDDAESLLESVRLIRRYLRIPSPRAKRT